MNTLEKRIAFSFGVLCLAFVAMTVLTFVQVNAVMESSRRIQHVLEPSIEANLRMTIAMNRSIASVRGWMLTKDDLFIRQRQASWSVIGKHRQQLLNYSTGWRSHEQVERLNLIFQKLTLFQEHQEAIEMHAHTDKHALALQMLNEEYSSLGSELIAGLRHISDPQNWAMERIFLKEEQQEQVLKNIALLFLFLSIVGGVSLAILLNRAVFLPLNRTIELANAVAQGHYSLSDEQLSGEEQLDVALRTMTRQLREKREENELQQQKLESSNQQLKASNEELSQFSYRTSHDLRAPLITVRGLAEAIQEDVESGDYKEVDKNAGRIAVHVKRLEDLVIDILNLAKAELEVTEIEKIDVAEIVEGIQEKLKLVYINNDVTIETNIDPAIQVWVSKVRLNQVLENLISNAIKYSDQNKSSRFVRVSVLRRETKIVCIIEDNGVGIPEEFHLRVFSMFQRFHADISYGSGLGMYIIKKHIDKMDAQIYFTSSSDGTRFLIAFPDIEN